MTRALPFAELLEPIVHEARGRLVNADIAGAPAMAAFERALLDRLSFVLARPLYKEFSVGRPPGARLVGAVLGDAGDDHYRAFVARGLDAVLLAYPVTGSLAAVVVEQWVQSVNELLERARRDHGKRIVNARAGLSDPHRGGRTVAMLELEDGSRVYYKPRSLAIEAAFACLVEWCNANDAPPGLRAARVDERDGYGWMEAIEPVDAPVDAGVFYRNAGALLALLHVLRATDCHVDNLVAAGEHLVLVDGEALLQPDVPFAATPEQLGFPGSGELAKRVTASAGRTGMLPVWTVDSVTGALQDVSALGAIGEAGVHRMSSWESVGRDDMRLIARMEPSPEGPSRPKLREPATSIAPFAEAIADGFAAMYDFLRAHRDALPLEPFRSLPIRFVHRATRMYGAVLERALSPARVANAADFEAAIAVLLRPVPADDLARRRVVNAEISALRTLDVPYFEADSSSTSLDVGDGAPLESWFERPSFDAMRATLDEMSDADRDLQVQIIRGMALAHSSGMSRSVSEIRDRAPSPSRAEPSALIAAADRIAEMLANRALRDGDASAYWLGFGAVRGSDRLQFLPSGESLYDGNVGIALFLAAHGHARGSTQYAELTRAALAPVQRYLRLAPGASSQWFAERTGLGGATGLGSLVYGFTKIATLTGDLSFIDDARRAAALISPTLIAADRALDVVDGAAGAILGLLALHAETDDASALALAEACARHILDSPKPELPLGGFSHGASGIAIALSRLAAVTQDVTLLGRCVDAVAGYLEYEESLFQPEAGQWRDVRGAGGEHTSWCHGSAGIGLARLELGADDADLKCALSDVRRSTGHLDHLCCGEAGRIELLIEAGRQLNRTDLLDEAVARAGALASSGGHRLFPPPADNVFNAGLFQGVSGIGYTMLRATGTNVPSVLLWK